MVISHDVLDRFENKSSLNKDLFQYLTKSIKKITNVEIIFFFFLKKQQL